MTIAPVSLRRGLLADLEQLAGGLGTALLALLVLGWSIAVAVSCLVGVGLLAVPALLRTVRGLADRERARLSRWGPELPGSEPLPVGWRRLLADRSARRELGWLAQHGVLGLLAGLIGICLPLYAVRELTFPLWWWLLPEGAASDQLSLLTATDWAGAFTVASFGLVWAVATIALVPALRRLQSAASRRLLRPVAGLDLSLRVHQLTASRAAALDAHAVELTRIERALHDGTQNRLVTVSILLGAAGRMVAGDPAAREVIGRAQTAAEDALADLRAVVRGILPPVLTDRGLSGALDGLAAGCPLPVGLEVDVPGRCPASVEATAYFVVAEALTNAARHSRAGRVDVVLRRRGDRLSLCVTDDGAGGAGEHHGSGLHGIRRRVEAHDGALRLTSPTGGPTVLEAELPCGS